MGIPKAQQLLWRCRHLGVFSLPGMGGWVTPSLETVWKVLSHHYDPSCCLKLPQFTTGTHYQFSIEHWKCAPIANQGNFKKQGGPQRGCRPPRPSPRTVQPSLHKGNHLWEPTAPQLLSHYRDNRPSFAPPILICSSKVQLVGLWEMLA